MPGIHIKHTQKKGLKSTNLLCDVGLPRNKVDLLAISKYADYEQNIKKLTERISIELQKTMHFTISRENTHRNQSVDTKHQIEKRQETFAKF